MYNFAIEKNKFQMLFQSAVEPGTLELLKTICQLPEFNSFALGRGTNLALRNGHRLSVDLDFFTSTPFNTTGIYKAISTKFKPIELLFEQNQTMMFLINNIKVDFVLYPFDWLNNFDNIEETRLFSLEDIIPMKLQAMCNRFSKKDFWDIELLLENFSLNKMIDIFKLKFPPVDPGFIIHSLTNFEHADTEEDPVSLTTKTWEEIKQNLEKTVIAYTNQFL
jgi:hypothetical protein